jgi:hypothetical protein
MFGQFGKIWQPCLLRPLRQKGIAKHFCSKKARETKAIFHPGEKALKNFCRFCSAWWTVFKIEKAITKQSIYRTVVPGSLFTFKF